MLNKNTVVSWCTFLFCLVIQHTANQAWHEHFSQVFVTIISFRCTRGRTILLRKAFSIKRTITTLYLCISLDQVTSKLYIESKAITEICYHDISGSSGFTSGPGGDPPPDLIGTKIGPPSVIFILDININVTKQK